jgi:hypothetical protein
MGRSDFLFASPSFWTGAGRVLDLGASLERYSYNISATPEEADLWAVANDWLVVGQDFAKAMQAHQSETAESAK